MRILPPERRIKDGLVTLSAGVRLDGAGPKIPDEIWFKFPEQFEHLCARGIEPFVVALSPLASLLNEEIEIDSAFSERLKLGLDEYWKIINSWLPQKFHQVHLRGAELTTDAHVPGYAAAAFSGGIDSFFTQFTERDRPPGYRTKFAVFAHGFDIPLALEDVFERAAAEYERALRACGVELVRMKSNVRAFVPDWNLGHGTALGAAGLALAGGVNRFLIPSSMSYTTLKPWGSSPMIDGLLSTDRVQVIHDGAYYSRFDKISMMKDWEPLRKLCRVCYEKPDAMHNCGRCHKCRRTMLVLDSLGVLKDFKTFSSAPTPFQYLNGHWETPHELLFGTQAIAAAEKSGRHDLAWATRIAMQRTKIAVAIKRARKLTRPLRRRYDPSPATFTANA
ncbi:hypothetical protein [Hyphomicrobium sp.]|uniref:hypothetical protein n=1 Tax=Hyphomicrobium sp. TaxID=82 RepID=UPI000FB0C6D2|nr:hypothetical protein [Hyphomicrobium sp.]RUP11135.1 MAG: hypothetical protein EKK38_01390 [Hyphomicrobium sp.]